MKILGLTLTGKRQPIVSEAAVFQPLGRRGFARGAVIALPLALLLWALLIWQF